MNITLLNNYDIVICGVAVFLGTAVQAGIGIGLGQVAVPIIALVRPELLPATLLMLACPLTFTMAILERSAIDKRGFSWMFVGRMVGSLIGGWLVTIANDQSIQALSGGLILGAVFLSIQRGFLPIRVESLLSVGFISGIMGTAAVVGGPPLALLYQDRPGPELRSTLSLMFAFGTVFSLLVLWIAGEIQRFHLITALLYTPVMALGYLFGRKIISRLQASTIKIGVLLFSCLGGTAALVLGILR